MNTNEFKESENDNRGKKIERIYSISSEYVVYRTKDEILYFIGENHSKWYKPWTWKGDYSKRIAKIALQLATINSLLPADLNKEENFAKEVAIGINQCLDGHIDSAKEILKKAIQRFVIAARKAARTTKTDLRKTIHDLTDEYRVGEKDGRGQEIIYIYVKTPDYIIYNTESGVRVFTDDDDLKFDEAVYYKRYLSLTTLLNNIKSLLPPNQRIQTYYPEIAQAIHQCMEDEDEDGAVSKNILNRIQKQFIQFRQLIGRLSYLLGSFIVFIIFTLLLLAMLSPASSFLSILSSFLKPILTIGKILNCKSLDMYVKMLFWGAMGGFFSVGIGVWKLDVNLDADMKDLKTQYGYAGAFRVFMAGIAGIIAFLAVKSKIILAPSDNSYGLYLIGVASGFSERFIPNIIGKISSEQNKNPATPPDKNPPDTNANNKKKTEGEKKDV